MKPPTFTQITSRMEATARIAQTLANVRLTHAKAQMAELENTEKVDEIKKQREFLKLIKKRNRSLRQLGNKARKKIKQLEDDWKSAIVLFYGFRIQTYKIRSAAMTRIMSEIFDDSMYILFNEGDVKNSSFISNNSRRLFIPKIPVNNTYDLLMWMLSEQLICKPYGAARRLFWKMFAKVNETNQKKLDELLEYEQGLQDKTIEIFKKIPEFDN